MAERPANPWGVREVDDETVERLAATSGAHPRAVEMGVDIERGRWIDPAGADLALGTWATLNLLPVTPDAVQRALARGRTPAA